MAAIWNDINITWKEKAYTVRPTLEFINPLEQRPGNSLTNLISLAGQEKLGTVKCAEILHDTLTYVGADVENVDEVWKSFGGIGEGLTRSAWAILAACLPQPKVEEGEEAPKKPAPKRKPSRKPIGAKHTA